MQNIHRSKLNNLFVVCEHIKTARLSQDLQVSVADTWRVSSLQQSKDRLVLTNTLDVMENLKAYHQVIEKLDRPIRWNKSS